VSGNNCWNRAQKQKKIIYTKQTTTNIKKIKDKMALVESNKRGKVQYSEISDVHIRIQQRNGRKCVTTIQGLAIDLDQKKICKYFRKAHNTNGSVLKSKEGGNIIQVQGDQREAFKEFLTTYQMCKAEEIKIHGF